MEREFDIGGRPFKLCKIDVFKQFHIARRIAPLLADIVPVLGDLKKLKGFDDLPNNDKLDNLAKLAKPLMDGLAKLSDEDSNRVLFGLLSAVEVNHMGSWTKVSTDSMLMVQDMELPVLLQVAGRAFMYNLSGFFAAVPAKA